MDMSVIHSSMIANLTSLQSAINTSVLDKSMDMASADMSSVLDTLPETSAPQNRPSFGHRLDTYA